MIEKYFFNNFLQKYYIIKYNYNSMVTRLDYKTWLIYQEKINSIFDSFILKSYISYFQLLTFFITISNILLLLATFFLYQLGYNFISTKFFLKKKFYIFYRAKIKQLTWWLACKKKLLIDQCFSRSGSNKARRNFSCPTKKTTRRATNKVVRRRLAAYCQTWFL